MEGEFPVLTGYALAGAAAGPDGVRLDVTDAAGRRTELTADHVIAATGYRPDLGRLSFLDPELRARLRTVARTPALDRDYQTSLPGLYAVGPGVAPTFGPVMRFVYGTEHAARTVSRRVSTAARRRRDRRGAAVSMTRQRAGRPPPGRAAWSRAAWSRAAWNRAAWSRAAWNRAAWNRAAWSRSPASTGSQAR